MYTRLFDVIENRFNFISKQFDKINDTLDLQSHMLKNIKSEVKEIKNILSNLQKLKVKI